MWPYIYGIWSPTLLLALLCLRVASQSCGCCPDGWVTYKGSCYLFSTLAKVHATEARHYCNQHGGHLVRIETSTENAFLEDYIRHLDGRHFWLDLTDEIAEGVWVWQSNNSPATFTDWDDGEPSPIYGDTEDCAAISMNAPDHGRWIDLPCTWSFASPLCEKSLAGEAGVIMGK